MDRWYFAYGSNLLVEQMVARVGPMISGNGQARIARLPGYELMFNMQSENAQFYSNITQPGDGVIGVVYRCSEESLTLLDQYELGYDRRDVIVVDSQGHELSAVAYFARNPKNVSGTPSKEYLQRICVGARMHGLPTQYIQSIEDKARIGEAE